MAIVRNSLVLFISTLIVVFIQCASEVTNRPNIVVIMADDMGFDDVSFRGSNEFLTPNIDALAYSGVILNRYYVAPMCTPSRAALMTGKFPINTGMQHYVIPNDEPWGLPLTEKTLAQVFKEAGYYTSLIGKWHLGFAEKAYTPLFRGFDHHYGYLGAFVDYYDQTLYSNKPYARGHDFRNNLNVNKENQGDYVTDSLTEEAVRLITEHDTQKPLLMFLNHLAPHSGNNDHPLQAPEEDIEKFDYIKHKHRRTYAAMVSKLDESVGKVVSSLAAKGILNNTIILFYSDNGAPTFGLHANNGSNYPLRGQKESPWEGAIRSSAAFWSTSLQNPGRIWNQTMHVTDWLPTLAGAAGINLDQDLNLDGINLWAGITSGTDSIPRKLVHAMDDILKYTAYTSGEWKYVNGTTDAGRYDAWLGKRSHNHIDPRSLSYEEAIRNSPTWTSLAQHTTVTSDIEILRQTAAVTCLARNEISRCEPLVEECIFNIYNDPCEQNNLIDQMRDSDTLNTIRNEVDEFRKNAKPSVRKPTDPNCDPKFYDFEWTWWKDIEQ